MTIQTFTAGQKLTALQMNTLQASDFNFTRNVRTDLSYTFVLADKGKLVESTNAGSATFTIPTNADAAFTIGDRIDVLLASDGSVTIVGASGVTVYAEGDLTTISSKWTKVTLIKRATDSWVVTGGGLTVQTVELDDLSVTTGKLANSAVTSAKIADGTIVNDDINAAAAIALSKLASGTSAQVIIANSSGVPTYTTLSGDVTVSNTGVVTIAADSVALGTDTTGNYVQSLVAGTGITLTNGTASEGGTPTISVTSNTYQPLDADLTAIAALSGTSGILKKTATDTWALDTATFVTTSDTGSVTSTMIADGTIVNGDINASAAIALSKLASGTSAQVILANSSGVPTYTSVTGDVTITNAGVTSIGSGKVTSAMIVDGTIVDGDISSSASISRGKIADMTIDTKTSNYTLVLTDANKLIEMNITSTANTVSVPTDASVNFPIGTQINITQYGTGKTQVVAVTPATTSIRSTPGAYLRAQYSSATLIKRAANEWYLIGDLSAT